MSVLKKIFSAGASQLIDSVKDAVDEFHLSGEEKNSFIAKMESLFQKRDSEVEETIRTELNAKMQVITAELNQGDNYTKRARPTVIYFGLFAIFWNHMLVPVILSAVKITLLFIDTDKTFPDDIIVMFNLPVEFWVAWGGITSTYVIGRSAEKRGIRNRFTSMATGSESYKKIPNILD